MSGARNLHRLAGARERLYREAATGPCAMHPDRPSVGYIDTVLSGPRGTCEACRAQGERLGYIVHTLTDDSQEG